jgi:hypothetical protein
MGEDKVRWLIATGQLAAVNTAAVLCGRPRWVITPEAIAEFERLRRPSPPPKPPRRRRKPAVRDYYPD